MTGNIFTVFRKELLEVSRDRKTLIFMIVLPLLFIPLLIQVTFDFMADAEKEATEARLDYAIFGGEQLPELAEELAAAGKFSAATLDAFIAKLSPKGEEGDTYSFTFAEAGEYLYYCEPHLTMNAKVIVVP